MDQISIIVPGKHDTIIALTKAEKVDIPQNGTTFAQQRKMRETTFTDLYHHKILNLKLDIYTYTGYYNLRVTFLTIYNFVHFQVVLHCPQSFFIRTSRNFKAKLDWLGSPRIIHDTNFY